jgi:anti-anti-sigma factor
MYLGWNAEPPFISSLLRKKNTCHTKKLMASGVYSPVARSNPLPKRNIREMEGVVGLQISTRECDDVSILDLLGRSTINGRESESLSRHLRDLIATGKRNLLLNLTNLVQIDSSGVGVIIEMHVALRRSGGNLKILGPRGRVLDVLKVFRLLDVIPSFDHETEALDSFRPRGYFTVP